MDLSTLLMIVLMGAALYFLLIRPQQKRAKEQQKVLAALAPGDRVMTVSGIIGTIRYIGERQAILEVGPGMEITMDKRAISTQPVTDEFEYEEDGEIRPIATDEPAGTAAEVQQAADDATETAPEGVDGANQDNQEPKSN